MQSKRKVLWLSDEAGWAYSNNSVSLSANLSQFVHKHINYKYEQITDADLEQTDLIVVSHPTMLRRYQKYVRKMIIRFATRLFKISGNGRE
jgi:hypothetical protein